MGSAARTGTDAVMQQQPVAMAAQHRLRHRRFQMPPPVIRIVSGIHACPNRRIAPAPRDPGPVQVAQLLSRAIPPVPRTPPFEPPAKRTTLPPREAEP